MEDVCGAQVSAREARGDFGAQMEEAGVGVAEAVGEVDGAVGGCCGGMGGQEGGVRF